MDLPIDYTTTRDGGRLERLEQYRPCLHRFPCSHSPHQGKGVPVKLKGQTRVHDGHTSPSQMRASCKRSYVYSREHRVHNHVAYRRERGQRPQQHRHRRDGTQVGRLRVIWSSTHRQSVGILHQNMAQSFTR